MAEVLVITGASAGVGRAVAQRFARRGCNIGLIARGRERLEAAATEVALGTVWGTMAALRRMRARNRGTIVLVGSALAYRGIPLQAPYCGAKHAIKLLKLRLALGRLTR